MLSQRNTGVSWVPSGNAPSGSRTFYVYDGSDVALIVVKSGSASWWVKSRYLTGGVDNNLQGRFRSEDGGLTRNLVLINDRLGSTLASLHSDNTLEPSTQYFDRDPYGGLKGATGTGGTINTETGFAGASTPNGTGGFLYLRSRWYDPKTGRFLTQDPIGLAGGVNLYSYAGNNPIAYTDPFGLCPPELTGRPCLLPVNDKPLLRGSFDNPMVGEFGMVRDGGTRAHQGIDILGTPNTLALAADRGKVTFVGERAGYGLMVEIGHANAEGKTVSYTAYAHLASASVKKGQRVTAGQDIGVVGRSGNVPADAPTQLHFEIRTRSMPGKGLGGRRDPLDELSQLVKVPQ